MYFLSEYVLYLYFFLSKPCLMKVNGIIAIFIDQQLFHVINHDVKHIKHIYKRAIITYIIIRILVMSCNVLYMRFMLRNIYDSEKRCYGNRSAEI